MKIQSKNQCYHLICEMHMLEHIVAHSLQVCRVGLGLVVQLKAQGKHLNAPLVQAAALLHDITKTRSFKTQENHALTGGQFLCEAGFPAVGDLVRQHVRLDDYSPTKSFAEPEIVNYADKRVLHDRIVSLDERMHYIMAKYGKKPAHQKRIEVLYQKTRDLEKKIFSQLPFSPAELDEHLSGGDISSEILNYQKRCSQHASRSR